ncbi:hypothetical protein D3C76_581640 [compost metagenome]
MVALVNRNVVIRFGNKWLNEDEQFVDNKSEAREWPYEVAEAYVMYKLPDGGTLEFKELIKPKTLRKIRRLQWEIRFFESFREPADTTNFPGWITKQVNKRKAKIERLKSL